MIRRYHSGSKDGHSRAKFASRIAPESTGVYLFYSDDRQLLYVGKAKNLRNRLRQHFSKRLAPHPSRQRIAAASTAWLSWICTDTELQALVLEDTLIKRLAPITNKQLKKWRSMQWVAIDDAHVRSISFDSDERIKHERGARIFGPFRDEYFVQRLYRFGAHYIGIRIENFTTLKPDSIDATTPEQDSSADSLRWFAAFLDGTDTQLLSVLQARIESLARYNRFEEAARVRDDLYFAEKFLERREFIHRFVNEALLVETLADTIPSVKFIRGRLISSQPEGQDILPDESDLTQNPLGESWIHSVEGLVDAGFSTCNRSATSESGKHVEPDWILADRADVVHRWLAQCGYDYRFISVDASDMKAIRS